MFKYFSSMMNSTSAIQQTKLTPAELKKIESIKENQLRINRRLNPSVSPKKTILYNNI